MQIMLKDKTYMTSMKTVQFSWPPTCLVQLRPKFFHPLDFARPISNEPSPPLQMIINQLNENIIQGWLLYVVRFFLQVGIRFQYQLIDLVWLSIDFFSFSWSQPRPQSNLKKLKISFSSSSYCEKMCCSQGWAEALLSAFSWLYILVCAIVQKHHEMFFIYYYSHL